MSIVEQYGPWAVVAGASAGIGAAWAEEVAGHGINLVTIARRAELLEAEAERLRAAHGVEVRPLAIDLAADDLAARVSAAIAGLEVGLFIYNAALAPHGHFFDVDLDEHLLSIKLNAVAPTVLTHLLGPPMVERGHGGIVIVGSPGAYQGSVIFSTYNAGKAYEWILAESIWAELRGSGVDVVGYMVGATAGDNYETPVHLRELDVTALDPTLAKAVEGIRSPVTCDYVARNLFDQMTDGPTVYANSHDAELGDAVLAMSRREATEHMSSLVTLGFG